MKTRFDVGDKVCVSFGKKGKKIECGKVKDISLERRAVYHVKFEDGGLGNFHEDELRKVRRKR